MTTTALFLTKKLRTLDHELPSEIKRVQEKSDDEAVHDLRVTIRKLRIVLKLARPVFGRFYTDAVREAFRQAQSATGNLRDEEALEETFRALKVEDAPAKEWLAKRATRKRALHKSVMHVIEAGDLRRARHLLGALLTLPAKPDKSWNLEKFSRKCVDRARKEVDSHRDAKTDDVEAMHELRIAFKGLRYTVETFAEVLPADLRALKEPAEKMQKIWEHVHGVDVSLVTLARARGMDEPSRQHMKEKLVARRAEKIAAFEAEMHPMAPQEEPLFI